MGLLVWLLLFSLVFPVLLTLLLELRAVDLARLLPCIRVVLLEVISGSMVSTCHLFQRSFIRLSFMMKFNGLSIFPNRRFALSHPDLPPNFLPTITREAPTSYLVKPPSPAAGIGVWGKGAAIEPPFPASVL